MPFVSHAGLRQPTQRPTNSSNQRAPPTKPLDLDYIAGEALRPPQRPLPLFFNEIPTTKQPRKAYYLGMAPSSSKIDPCVHVTEFYRTPESIPQGRIMCSKMSLLPTKKKTHLKKKQLTKNTRGKKRKQKKLQKKRTAFQIETNRPRCKLKPLARSKTRPFPQPTGGRLEAIALINLSKSMQQPPGLLKITIMWPKRLRNSGTCGVNHQRGFTGAHHLRCSWKPCVIIVQLRMWALPTVPGQVVAS